MTATKQEVILAYVETLLTAVSGVTVYRDRTEPFRREEVPAANILMVQDIPSYNVIDFAEWNMQFTVKIHTRGTEPDDLADSIKRDMYAAIMADRSLGNRAQDITPAGFYYQILEGDQPIGVTDLVFQVQYRTKASDLTQ